METCNGPIRLLRWVMPAMGPLMSAPPNPWQMDTGCQCDRPALETMGNVGRAIGTTEPNAASPHTHGVG
eukprot:7543031-Lingulodinium_polyedra.AAC.1